MTIPLKAIFFTLVIIAMIIESLGDVLFRKWALESKNVILLLGVIAYLFASIVWAFSLRYEYVSKAITVAAILNLIIVVLVGVVYFKEDLSTTNKIGIFLGILSLILIES